jgi:ferredoxin hydrogenase large subunit
LKGVKSAAISLKDGKYDKDLVLRVAVVHGMGGNITPIVDQVLAGRSPYHFIEVMNCPGGCINGGGQPIQEGGSSWLEGSLPWFAWK